MSSRELNLSNAAKQAEVRPFPRDETTPQVTKTYRAMEGHYSTFKKKIKVK